jgi:hypothetical protein
VPIVLKSGNLTLLEPSGPVQACNGIVLPFYSLCKEPNIAEDIKIRRLGWAGHTIRMEEERIPKRFLNGNFHTTGPVGRPRPRRVGMV